MSNYYPVVGDKFENLKLKTRESNNNFLFLYAGIFALVSSIQNARSHSVETAMPNTLYFILKLECFSVDPYGFNK